jgi:hypothetical protein
MFSDDLSKRERRWRRRGLFRQRARRRWPLRWLAALLAGALVVIALDRVVLGGDVASWIAGLL